MGGRITEREFTRRMDEAFGILHMEPDPFEDNPELERCDDPALWTREILGLDFWEKQAEIAASFRDNPVTAVRSCHAAGKSCLGAALTLWTTQTKDPAVVITTAPTDRQVREILWGEIHKLHARARTKLKGRLLVQALRVSPDVYAFGFTAPETASEKFQGFHAARIYIIVDESSRVSDEIFEAIDGISTGEVHVLLIGNPTRTSGRFYDAFHDPAVVKFGISVFDTPNFTAYGITEDDIVSGAWADKYDGSKDIPGLVTPDWAARMYEIHGLDSPFYRARVRAEFPLQEDDTLMSIDDVTACMDLEVEEINEPADVVVDVARYGSDQTVIGVVRSISLRIAKALHGRDTMHVAGETKRVFDDTENARGIRIDSIGVGAGVADRLIEQKLPVVEMVASEKSSEPDKFLNKRAEWWWTAADRVKAHTVKLPRNEYLARDLTTIKYPSIPRA